MIMRILPVLAVCWLPISGHGQAPPLDGITFRGTLPAEHRAGCEGCGNSGTITFRPGSVVDVLLPGSDIMDRKTYIRAGDRLTLEGGQVSMQMQGDTLFVRAYEQRYIYVRAMPARR